MTIGWMVQSGGEQVADYVNRLFGLVATNVMIKPMPGVIERTKERNMKNMKK